LEADLTPIESQVFTEKDVDNLSLDFREEVISKLGNKPYTGYVTITTINRLHERDG